MPLTPEEEAIAAPFMGVATELVAMLKEDRALAINFAKHHGLIPGDYDEPATAEWLRKVLATSPACPHCGGTLYDTEPVGR